MFDLRTRDGVARLTLSRPEARNAIPASGWAVLRDAIEEVPRSGARMLVITGAGTAFCAGADISDFAAMRDDEDARARFRTDMRSALDALRDLPLPTLAVIDGPCFGAGVALAMACDLRAAGSAAQFAITPAKLGISYPQEDIHRLISLVGEGQAARMLFSGRAIDGAEAERIGLVERYAADGLQKLVDIFVTAVLANSADSIATLKRGVRLAAGGLLSDDGQDRRFDSLLGSDELAERLGLLRKGRGLA